MPVFPKYYNPQLDENDYRRNMMRVFRIEKNQDNNTDYASNSASASSSSGTSNPQSSVGKYEENLDSEISSIDEKITVLHNTLNEVDDDMKKYKTFYDSVEFTMDALPVLHAPGHVAAVMGAHVHDPDAKYINTLNASAQTRAQKLDHLQPPIESKINRAEGLLATILNQYKSKISGKHLNRYKKEEWIKIQQTFNKLFAMVEDTLATSDIYKACIINRTGLTGAQKINFHNPPADFAHRLQTTLTDFKDIFNSDKSRYSYNLGKY